MADTTFFDYVVGLDLDIGDAQAKLIKLRKQFQVELGRAIKIDPDVDTDATFRAATKKVLNQEKERIRVSDKIVGSLRDQLNNISRAHQSTKALLSSERQLLDMKQKELEQEDKIFQKRFDHRLKITRLTQRARVEAASSLSTVGTGQRFSRGRDPVQILKDPRTTTSTTRKIREQQVAVDNVNSSLIEQQALWLTIGQAVDKAADSRRSARMERLRSTSSSARSDDLIKRTLDDPSLTTTDLRRVNVADRQYNKLNSTIIAHRAILLSVAQAAKQLEDRNENLRDGISKLTEKQKTSNQTFLQTKAAANTRLLLMMGRGGQINQGQPDPVSQQLSGMGFGGFGAGGQGRGRGGGQSGGGFLDRSFLGGAISPRAILRYLVVYRAAIVVTRKFQEAIRETIRTIVELDKIQGQIAKVLPTYARNQDNLNSITEQGIDVAKRYGISIQETISSMTLLFQQGLSTVEVIKRVNAAMTLSTVTNLDPAKAVEVQTAFLKIYGNELNTVGKLTESLLGVESKHAITSMNLAEAFLASGSAAKELGVEFDQLLGLITAIGVRTRDTGNKIGTGLRFILPRIISDQAVKSLSREGVSVFGQKQGGEVELRDAGKILDDLAMKWGSLDKVTKAYIATSIAGRRRMNQFIAMMNGYGEAVIASLDANLAAGKSLEATATIVGRLDRRIQRLKNQFSDFGFTLGRIGIKDLMLSIVSSIDMAMGEINKLLDKIPNLTEKGKKITETILLITSGPEVRDAFKEAMEESLKVVEETPSEVLEREYRALTNIPSAIKNLISAAKLQEDDIFTDLVPRSSDLIKIMEDTGITVTKQYKQLLTDVAHGTKIITEENKDEIQKNLTSIFTEIPELVDKSRSKISSRINEVLKTISGEHSLLTPGVIQQATVAQITKAITPNEMTTSLRDALQELQRLRDLENNLDAFSSRLNETFRDQVKELKALEFGFTKFGASVDSVINSIKGLDSSIKSQVNIATLSGDSFNASEIKLNSYKDQVNELSKIIDQSKARKFTVFGADVNLTKNNLDPFINLVTQLNEFGRKPGTNAAAIVKDLGNMVTKGATEKEFQSAIDKVTQVTPDQYEEVEKLAREFEQLSNEQKVATDSTESLIRLQNRLISTVKELNNTENKRLKDIREINREQKLFNKELQISELENQGVMLARGGNFRGAKIQFSIKKERLALQKESFSIQKNLDNNLLTGQEIILAKERQEEIKSENSLLNKRESLMLRNLDLEKALTNQEIEFQKVLTQTNATGRVQSLKLDLREAKGFNVSEAVKQETALNLEKSLLKINEIKLSELETSDVLNGEESERLKTHRLTVKTQKQLVENLEIELSIRKQILIEQKKLERRALDSLELKEQRLQHGGAFKSQEALDEFKNDKKRLDIEKRYIKRELSQKSITTGEKILAEERLEEISNEISLLTEKEGIIKRIVNLELGLERSRKTFEEGIDRARVAGGIGNLRIEKDIAMGLHVPSYRGLQNQISMEKNILSQQELYKGILDVTDILNGEESSRLILLKEQIKTQKQLVENLEIELPIRKQIWIEQKKLERSAFKRDLTSSVVRDVTSAVSESYQTRKSLERDLETARREGDRSRIKQIEHDIKNLDSAWEDALIGGINAALPIVSAKLMKVMTNRFGGAGADKLSTGLAIGQAFGGLAGGGGRGAQAGAGLGSIVGAGGALIAGAGPYAPLAAAIVGIAGGAIGGMLDDTKEALIDNTLALRENTQTLENLNERILGAPAGFTLPAGASTGFGIAGTGGSVIVIDQNQLVNVIRNAFGTGLPKNNNLA